MQTFIDVSQHQGLIDWKGVQTNTVIIRCGYRSYVDGHICSDAQAHKNLVGASGKHIGLYFYSQAVSEDEARQEADFCVAIADGTKIDMPIFFDSEYSGRNKTGRADNLTIGVRTQVCKAFCDEIKARGYIPGVYASTDWFKSHLDFSQLICYKIWCAEYADECKLNHYDYWQYTSHDSEPGIKTRVDRSYVLSVKEVGVGTLELINGIGEYSLSQDGGNTLMIDGKITNFKVAEFACHDGSDVILIDRNNVIRLQQIRDHFGKPVHINSGYRTESYNVKVGGAPKSYHVKGMAADIVVDGISPLELAMYAQSIGTQGIGWYDKFTHVDSRSVRYYWHNKSGNPVGTFLPILKQGAKGEYVKVLQRNLGISQDGEFGTGTLAAVKGYQANHNLTIDGKVGINTWGSIF